MYLAASSSSRAPSLPLRRPAFTLAELLVVIGIIAVALGVLLPAIARARGAASSLTCQASMRQWATAAVLYAQRNGDCLPRRGQGIQPAVTVNRPEDWFNALPPFLNLTRYADLAHANQIPRPGAAGGRYRLWLCPEAADSASTNFFGYAMNMRLSTWDGAQPDHLTAVAPLSLQVFLAEAPGPYCSVLPSSQAYSAVARHRGRTNIAFLDGHVAAYTAEYVGCGIGDPKRDDVQWIVPNSPWAGPPK